MKKKCSEKLPETYDVDVLVVGGGPAGVGAAFSAARNGMKTLVIEQFNCLGGVATAGGHGHLCIHSAWNSRTRTVGGIPFEMAQRVVKAGYGAMDPTYVDFEVEGMKLILEQMAEECNCKILYHTFFCSTVVEKGKAVGAIIQNKTGRQIVRAKMIIDCTGDGDVAASAGCKFYYGDEDSGLCQPVTLMFTIGGVDWDRVKKWRSDWRMAHIWKKAQENGDMRPFQYHIMGWWWTPTRPDQVGINFTHMNFIDSTKAEDLTKATLEGRKQAYETIDVYRKYVPGMENCYMVSTPNTVGLRESRRILGEYYLTKNDVVGQKNFKDSIGYGSFFIDIHNTKGPGMDTKEWRPDPGFKYQIPYRIIVPLKVDNLFVTGRCASCDHEALGSLRQMMQCGVMGEAAGTAAAMCIRKKCVPRELPVKELQVKLRKAGAIIDETGIKKVNA